ncbi:UDP-4-amino-4,6-dideoxy-N-acetyl-beta-L-altrosamine transaminase [Vibrio sp. S4M6]|uniref:UDP-4-amino-4, 6-dideoxy-N-acetyl-beta-L-altrosamine transaminase n=1 Tax=Vibrio sinus TaxID=2946865 RepID=UPI002029C21F|nr:UDP-4-amino-4,6-dideoxy-N-acetyl-beta-L-altrosamine transaminase [Vibrio sinus]MCL9781549.1 UDP-4-amino-4,6-dideoxy-N-acetyl-beta-L-altrosamine transaminase [Vibrio sinus]
MIPYGKHFIEQDDIDAVVDVLKNGWLTQGPKIDEFEAKLAEMVGAKYAVAVSNATAGLHLACMATGLSKGDKALVSPNTFVSTPNAVLYCGARPVFVDMDPTTLNMCPEELGKELLRTSGVKVVLPVHFGGLPCDMESIASMVNPAGVKVIEDAAHALGASYQCGAKVGSCKYSDFTVFSLHPVKGVTTGEGGVITTNDYMSYKKLLQLRSHGICKGNFVHPGISVPDSEPLFCPENAFDSEGNLNPWYYEMQQLGFNYRMTDFQAALGVSQLKKLNRFVMRRQELALRYDEALRDIPFIEPAQPQYRTDSSIHIYIARISFDKLAIGRGEFMRRLKDMGIGSQVHYIPVHWQPYYSTLGYRQSACPNTNSYYEQTLTLPLYYGLTDEEFNSVIASLRNLMAIA